MDRPADCHAGLYAAGYGPAHRGGLLDGLRTVYAHAAQAEHRHSAGQHVPVLLRHLRPDYTSSLCGKLHGCRHCQLQLLADRLEGVFLRAVRFPGPLRLCLSARCTVNRLLYRDPLRHRDAGLWYLHAYGGVGRLPGLQPEQAPARAVRHQWHPDLPARVYHRRGRLRSGCRYAGGHHWARHYDQAQVGRCLTSGFFCNLTGGGLSWSASLAPKGGRYDAPIHRSLPVYAGADSRVLPDPSLVSPASTPPVPENTGNFSGRMSALAPIHPVAQGSGYFLWRWAYAGADRAVHVCHGLDGVCPPLSFRTGPPQKFRRPLGRRNHPALF